MERRDRFSDGLVRVWQEACRHIEISEAVRTIAPMLAPHLPLAVLLVRRFLPDLRAVETVGVGRASAAPFHGAVRQNCAPAAWKRLLAWARKGKILHGVRTERGGELDSLVPPEVEGEVLVGPLGDAQGPAGVLVLVGVPQQTFKAPHLSMMRSLLEPLSAALDNDRRLHELAALREAAEADRRSLLTRLGRQELNEQLVGAETGLRHVMERVQLVAQSDVPVLIFGDTGTGKEVVSRAIHCRSPRAAGPFIRINCGAIPPELIDSHLFGHEKGSFTGASDLRKGWFERADGGTLFLDEIGELPLPAQVRLLRVLQDHEVERVGGQQAIHVDVRIVAATHRDLAAMVKAGAFREDLWYRINIFPILLPRLRERFEDIPALARHFAQRAAQRFGLAYVEPSATDLSLLMDYSWPGNIRELGAVMDRAAILGGGKTLEVARALGFGPPASPSNSTASADAGRLATVAGPATTAESAGTIVSLDAAMKQHIERALLATRGRVEGTRGAAALLKINPHTLRARMRKLGVEWSKFRDSV